MINEQGRKMGIASLVLGICSCVTVFFGAYAFIGVILGIIGIVLGVKARKAGADTSQAKAGRITSIVGLCVSGVVFLASVLILGSLAILFGI